MSEGGEGIRAGCSSSDNSGINVRALEQLFSLLTAASSARRSGSGNNNTTTDNVSSSSSSTGGFSWKVRVQALEVYNESIKDLLVEPSQYKKNMQLQQQHMQQLANGSASIASTSAAAAALSASHSLDITHLPDGSVHIPGLTSKEVNSAVEIRGLLATYVRANRSTAATAMNEHSSRSHLCLFVHVDTLSTNPLSGETESTKGKLVLIDLAGSERVKRSHAEGQALKEAAHMSVGKQHTGTYACIQERKRGKNS